MSHRRPINVPPGRPLCRSQFIARTSCRGARVDDPWTSQGRPNRISVEMSSGYRWVSTLLRRKDVHMGHPRDRGMRPKDVLGMSDSWQGRPRYLAYALRFVSLVQFCHLASQFSSFNCMFKFIC